MPQPNQLIAFAAIVALLSLVGCGNLGTLQKDPPKVIGEEVDPNGGELRRIVFEHSYRVTGWVPDVHGGHETLMEYEQYFLEVASKPRQELTFLSEHFKRFGKHYGFFLPVKDSELWVTAGYFEPGEQITVFVFDHAGMRTHRRLEVARVDPESGEAVHSKPIWFEDANRTLRFRSPQGVRSYNICADSIE